jgi:hypothetical protein
MDSRRHHLRLIRKIDLEDKFVDTLLSGGVMFFAVSLLLFATSSTGSAGSDERPFLKTSLTDRDVAIRQALEKGETTYRYETSFVPGVGTIADPQSYLADLQDSWGEDAAALSPED